MQARGEEGRGIGEPCCPLTRPKLGPQIRCPGCYHSDSWALPQVCWIHISRGRAQESRHLASPLH